MKTVQQQEQRTCKGSRHQELTTTMEHDPACDEADEELSTISTVGDVRFLSTTFVVRVNSGPAPSGTVQEKVDERALGEANCRSIGGGEYFLLALQPATCVSVDDVS